VSSNFAKEMTLISPNFKHMSSIGFALDDHSDSLKGVRLFQKMFQLFNLQGQFACYYTLVIISSIFSAHFHDFPKVLANQETSGNRRKHDNAILRDRHHQWRTPPLGYQLSYCRIYFSVPVLI
jgi:hypothetical protein